MDKDFERRKETRALITRLDVLQNSGSLGNIGLLLGLLLGLHWELGKLAGKYEDSIPIEVIVELEGYIERPYGASLHDVLGKIKNRLAAYV